MSEVRLLTNHAMVLSHIAHQPFITAREISDIIGITERATRRIIDDLLAANYITKKREGRRNRYRISPERAISSPGLEKVAMGYLLEMLGGRKRGRPPTVQRE